MTEQDTDPFAYVGATIGNAHDSGLSIKDLLIAIKTVWELYESVTCSNPFERFDQAVAASIRIHELRERKTT